MSDHNFIVSPLPEYSPDLGAALWMLQDTRRRTLQAVDGLDPASIDALPRGAGNSIGSILYHLAATEVEWLYADILQCPAPAWTSEVLPHRSGKAHIAVAGMTLEEHVARLALVRHNLLEDLVDLDADEFDRPRPVEGGVTTPRWILHNLRQHEAEHRGQILATRASLEANRT